MKLFFYSLCAFLIISRATAQTDPEVIKEIEAIEQSLTKGVHIKGEPAERFNIADRMAHYNVPGISIAVIRDGKIRWAKGYGYANTATDQMVDENTLFQAGSISKPVAALSALQLMEAGKVDLEENVNTYLKGWQIADNEFTETEKVTLQRLLTHTAGTTVHGFGGYTQTDNFPSIIEVLSGKGNSPLVSVDQLPGSNWRYSGGGYTVMEKVVEDVSGLPLEIYLAKEVLGPIGMKRSTYEQPISARYQDNLSAAYNGEGELIEGLYNNYPEQAAAGLWTTPTDLAKYCIEVQEIMAGKENGVLQKSTVEKMLTKHQRDWGLGPALEGEGELLTFGHGGKNAGFTNNMVAYVHQGDGIIVMTNADNGGKLIQEIELAASAYYDWSIARVDTIELVELTETELAAVAGKYFMEAQEITIEIVPKDGGLFTSTSIGDFTLSPMSKTLFVDYVNGMKFEFSGEDKVNGLLVNESFSFKRVE